MKIAQKLALQWYTDLTGFAFWISLSLLSSSFYPSQVVATSLGHESHCAHYFIFLFLAYNVIENFEKLNICKGSWITWCSLFLFSYFLHIMWLETLRNFKFGKGHESRCAHYFIFYFLAYNVMWLKTLRNFWRVIKHFACTILFSLWNSEWSCNLFSLEDGFSLEEFWKKQWCH